MDVLYYTFAYAYSISTFLRVSFGHGTNDVAMPMYSCHRLVARHVKACECRCGICRAVISVIIILKEVQHYYLRTRKGCFFISHVERVITCILFLDMYISRATRQPKETNYSQFSPLTQYYNLTHLFFWGVVLGILILK